MVKFEKTCSSALGDRNIYATHLRQNLWRSFCHTGVGRNMPRRSPIVRAIMQALWSPSRSCHREPFGNRRSVSSDPLNSFQNLIHAVRVIRSKIDISASWNPMTSLRLKHGEPDHFLLSMFTSIFWSFQWYNNSVAWICSIFRAPLL